MTPLPLEHIGLNWRCHPSALWWLGLLYRRPQAFREAFEGLSRLQALVTGGVLYLHFLPYLLVLAVLGRLALVGVFGLQLRESISGELEGALLYHGFKIAQGIAVGIGFWIAGVITGVIVGVIAVGIDVGIAAGITVGISTGIAHGIAYGIFPGIIGGIAAGIAFGIAAGISIGIVGGMVGGITGGISMGIAAGIVGGIAAGIITGISLEITYGIAAGIVGGIAGGIVVGTAVGIAVEIARGSPRGNARGIGFGIAGGIGFGIVGGIIGGIAYGIAYGIAVGVTLLRAYYYPVHIFFLWPVPKGRWYLRHPVAWDDLCSLPFVGLDRLLVSFAEHDQETGLREIDRLIDNYPSQRMDALRAKVRLVALEAADQKLASLDAVVAKLPEGDRGFLASTPRLREMVGEICQLQQRLDIQNRPFLKGPTADLLCEKIKNFQSQVSGFPEPLASEFRKAAQRWLEIGDGQRHQTQAILSREPTPQVFRAGDPVDRSKEAFVPREGVLGDLDRQLTLATGCPGLILYGRRRMGKSTLLRNLDGFLPTSIRVVNMSMQNPNAFTSLEDCFNLIATALREALPRLELGTAATTTLKAFAATLQACNEHLESEEQKLILAIDEYENLDHKIGEGVFPRDLLDALRESIQFHRRLIWVFAGSHAIEELEHANWSSYLVSARTLEVPPFTDAETRRLLTEPLRYSRLWKEDDPERPHFTPDFWGEVGIERIHAEAGGWPHLVQLLAETTVDLCNDQEKAGVTDALLEQAMTKAIVLGDAVLRELMQPKETSSEEWDYLRSFRTRDTQPIPESEPVYQALRRRLLVVPTNGEWQLRVPLMQRWLRERG